MLGSGAKSENRIKARFHYERGKEHFFSLLLIFDRSERLKLKRAQKKINKTNKECFFPRS